VTNLLEVEKLMAVIVQNCMLEVQHTTFCNHCVGKFPEVGSPPSNRGSKEQPRRCDHLASLAMILMNATTEIKKTKKQ
jgi:hypothetical protein